MILTSLRKTTDKNSGKVRNLPVSWLSSHHKINIMHTYSTITSTLNTLHKEGYSIDFNLKPNCVECKSCNIALYPGDFVIDKFYRFEGASSPDDSAIVYAISAKDGLKGTV